MNFFLFPQRLAYITGDSFRHCVPWKTIDIFVSFCSISLNEFDTQKEPPIIHFSFFRSLFLPIFTSVTQHQQKTIKGNDPGDFCLYFIFLPRLLTRLFMNFLIRKSISYSAYGYVMIWCGRRKVLRLRRWIYGGGIIN